MLYPITQTKTKEIITTVHCIKYFIYPIFLKKGFREVPKESLLLFFLLYRFPTYHCFVIFYLRKYWYDIIKLFEIFSHFCRKYLQKR